MHFSFQTLEQEVFWKPFRNPQKDINPLSLECFFNLYDFQWRVQGNDFHPNGR